MTQLTLPYRLFIIRHAESTANVNPAVHKEIPDHLIPLTEKGWFEQALPCGQFLNDYITQDGDIEDRVFALWHSSFLRACQTAKGIHMGIEHLNPYVWMRDSLGEVSFGYTDGLSEEEAAAAYPDYGQHMARDYAHKTKHFLRPPGGESRADAGIPSRQYIDTLQRKTVEYGITDHFAVTHGAKGRVIAKEFMNLSYEVTDAEKNPWNCDIRLIERSPDNIGYIDRGYIYKKGKPHHDEPKRYEQAIDRMRSGLYIPDFASH